MEIQSIDFKNKRALIRVDFNVPFNDKQDITDDTRIKAALPSIKYVLDNGGAVILMSHLGRPKGKRSAKLSLEKVAVRLSTLLDKEIKFIDNCIGPEVEKEVKKIKSGEIIVLENLRFYKEETLGDDAFAKTLSQHGDVYINDAYGTAHRAHASTAIVAKYFKEKCFGLLMQKEIENIQKVVKGSAKPIVAIIGGAKVSSKLGVIKNLIGKVDYIVVGGGMAFTFLKSIGGKIGDSLVEKDIIHIARGILKKSREKNTQILLPHDVMAADAFSAEANTKVCEAREIEKGWMGLDIGPQSIAKYTKCIENSKTILWNGPMGVFELDPFSKGTIEIAKAVSSATQKGAYSLVGGGDSVAALKKFKLEQSVSYISTGGGAMLESLEGKILPGVAAIVNS